MPDVHFPSLDLNLLRLFDALAEERSVTRAGVRLGLTQSAVSHALSRLRHALQDELFVRGPEGMRPTARAQEIAPMLRQGLEQLQAALAPADFVPGETRRRFSVAASTYIWTVLMPGVVERMRREAPGAELRLVRTEPTLGEDVLSGRVDLAIGSYGRSGQRFGRETLFTDFQVWAMRADHPLAGAQTIALATLVELPHVVVGSNEPEFGVEGRSQDAYLERLRIWYDGGALERAMRAAGRDRTVGLVVQDAQSALAIASRTDMVTAAPRRLARSLAGAYGLKLFDPPYEPAVNAIDMVWRRELSADPPLDWLRSVMRSAAAAL